MSRGGDGMSVLICGMEMPERCGQCFLRVGNCKQRVYMEHRPKGCPLVEVKEPHGRLGDLDKLMTEFIDSDLDHLQRDDWREVIQIVSDAETVIEAEGETE